MPLITLPLASQKDDLLLMIVATFLANNGVSTLSSYPKALQLVAALEHYSQASDSERCAEQLELAPGIVERYRELARL